MTGLHDDVLLIRAATLTAAALLIVIAVLCISWKDDKR